MLLYGEDLVSREELPKAGLFLALILNDDIFKTLDSAKKWMEQNPNAYPSDISAASKRLAKAMLDFHYGVVMANKPQYTASRKERIEQINEMFPQNKHVTETLTRIARQGVGEFESFNNMIEGFRPGAEKNFKKMRDVKAELEKTNK